MNDCNNSTCTWENHPPQCPRSSICSDQHGQNPPIPLFEVQSLIFPKQCRNPHNASWSREIIMVNLDMMMGISSRRHIRHRLGIFRTSDQQVLQPWPWKSPGRATNQVYPVPAKILSKSHWKVTITLSFRIAFDTKRTGCRYHECVSYEFHWICVTADEAISALSSISNLMLWFGASWYLRKICQNSRLPIAGHSSTVKECL